MTKVRKKMRKNLSSSEKNQSFGRRPRREVRKKMQKVRPDMMRTSGYQLIAHHSFAARLLAIASRHTPFDHQPTVIHCGARNFLLHKSRISRLQASEAHYAFCSLKAAANRVNLAAVKAVVRSDPWCSLAVEAQFEGHSYTF